MAWNGSNEKAGNAAAPARGTKHAARGTKHGLIAFALVALGGGLAAWLFMRPSEEPARGTRDEARGTLIAEVKPQIATNAVEAADEPTAAAVSEKKIAAAARPVPGTVVRARTARDGRVMTLMDGTVVTNRAKVIFTRDFENTLLVALRPGGMTNALFSMLRKKYSDAQIIAMLQEMTVPADGDDEGTAACKRSVQELKERMLLEIKDGRSVSDVLEDVRRQCHQERRVKVDAMRVRREALRTKDPETIREAYDASNKILEQGGLPTVRVPERYAAKETAAEEESFDQTTSSGSDTDLEN